MNGVPLKRVNQAYVIGTSTKVDLSGVKMPDIEDDFFDKEPQPEAAEGEDRFFANATKTGAVVSEARKAQQAALDAQLEPVVDGVDKLKAYLQAKFTLNNGDKPHQMLF